jgi:hypothetical protein
MANQSQLVHVQTKYWGSNAQHFSATLMGFAYDSDTSGYLAEIAALQLLHGEQSV